MISNFGHVLNVVFFLLGDSLASELYLLTFQNSVCSSFIGGVRRKKEQSVLKRQQIKFRCQVVTQEKEYNETVFVLACVCSSHVEQ